MNFTNEGGLIIMTLMMILISSWTAIAATPRHAYVPPVEYDQIEFDLCQDRYRYDINMGILNKTTN